LPLSLSGVSPFTGRVQRFFCVRRRKKTLREAGFYLGNEDSVTLLS
jgi:hypothetical protein